MLAIGAVYFYFSFDIRIFSWTAMHFVTSRTIPQFYAFFLALLSAILIVKGCREHGALKRAEAAGASSAANGKHAVSILAKYYSVPLTFVAMVLYAGTMAWLGFMISSALYVFFQTLILAPKGRVTTRTAAAAGGIAIVSSVLVEYVFVNHLGLILPACRII